MAVPEPIKRVESLFKSTTLIRGAFAALVGTIWYLGQAVRGLEDELAQIQRDIKPIPQIQLDVSELKGEMRFSYRRQSKDENDAKLH